MRHTIETTPYVVISRRLTRGGIRNFLDCQTLVAAALIGVYFHAEVVAYVARYASQQEISELITIVPPVMAQQTPLPKDDEVAQLKQAVDSATAELRHSLQQEHDRAEALATELVKAWRYVGKLLSMRRGGEADAVQPSGRQRDGGTAAFSAAGARQGRSTGNRTGEGATRRGTDTCRCGREARCLLARLGKQLCLREARPDRSATGRGHGEQQIGI